MRILFGAMTAVTLALAGTPPLFAQVQGQWTGTGFMQSARELDGQVPLSNGNAFAAGGIDTSSNVLASAEIYSGKKGTWVPTSSMQTARYYVPAVVLANGRVLVEGGLGTGGAVVGTAELFNPKKNTWASAASLKVARFGHTATLLPNGQVLVAGGCTASDCSTTTPTSEIYDPKTNSWSLTGSLTLARTLHSTVLLNTGKLLAIGGRAGAPTASCEFYDPATGSWSNAASTNQARYLNGTSVLPDGKVLVSGGVITRYPMNSAELYDPASNTWSLTGNLTTARYAHTSTLLPDGTVLLAGGEGQSISCGKDCTGFIPTAAAEIYNELTGTFSKTASLNRALAYQATTLLTGGQALTAGGDGYTATCCVVVPDAEFYTPLSITFSSASLNFGFLQVGLTSPAQTVTVTNVSGHSVSFTSIASSGDYSQTNNCPATLTPGQNCAIMASFGPSAAGTRNGAVTLLDDSPGSPKQTIALTGVGETLALEFSPSSLNLGSVAVGSSIGASTTLINDGASPVNLTGIAIAPANKKFTQTNNCPAALAVQQSCTFQVVFTPPDIFKYKATLSVTNSAGAAASLLLSGTGLDGGGADRPAAGTARPRNLFR